MAAAISVVAADCGGNEELFGDSFAGLIVPSGDVVALGGALRTCCIIRTRRKLWAHAAAAGF